MMTQSEPAIVAFRSKLLGELIAPGDPKYEEARQVYNAMIDRRPRRSRGARTWPT